MDRRGFFKFLGAGVAGIALEQAVPFGRVWSFPSKIVVPQLTPTLYDREQELRELLAEFRWDPLGAVMYYDSEPLIAGTSIRIRVPQRFVPLNSYLPVPAVNEYKDFIITAPLPVNEYKDLIIAEMCKTTPGVRPLCRPSPS